MKLITLAFISVVASLVPCGVADDQRPDMAFVYSAVNTEMIIGSQNYYTIFPGFEHAEPSDEVTLKIYKKDGSIESEVHSYRMTDEQAKEARTFRFALENSKSGQYGAKVCVKHASSNGEEPTCSRISSPLSPMNEGEDFSITCTRTLTKRGTTQTKTESLMAEILAMVSYAPDSVVKTLVAKEGSEAKKIGFTKNMEIKKSGENYIAYLVPDYDVTILKEFLRIDDYCTRKYLPVVLTHIIDKRTRLVVAKDRFSPFIRKVYYEKFLGLDINETDDFGQYKDKESAQTMNAPLQLFINLGTKSLEEGVEYDVWHTVCFLDKDNSNTNKVVECTKPYIKTWLI